MQHESVSEKLPFASGKPVGEMSLVEIAEQLEKVTSWIEGQRVRERDARNAYQAVAQEVERSVQQIRRHAQDLVDAQGRKVSSFSGMLARTNGSPQRREGERSAPAPRQQGEGRSAKGGKLNIADAIVAIWSLPGRDEAITTEDIAALLPATGYKSNAAPTSLKSSVNQALAKLCRAGLVIRYRSDGSRISPRDNKSRARKYLAASKASDE